MKSKFQLEIRKNLDAYALLERLFIFRGFV